MTLRYDIWAILATMGYLIASYVVIMFTTTNIPGMVMISISPVLVSLMVFVVLKYGYYRGPKLVEKEFGYHDRMTDKKSIEM